MVRKQAERKEEGYLPSHHHHHHFGRNAIVVGFLLTDNHQGELKSLLDILSASDTLWGQERGTGKAMSVRW